MKLTITDKVFVPISQRDENGLIICQSNRVVVDFVKEETNKYVLSKEELEKVISDAWIAARYNGINSFSTNKQYINSILNNND